MKILQLNAWNGRLDKHLLRFLKRQDADVLCLQEISSYEHAIPFVLQLEAIQQLGYHYTYFSPMFRYNALGLKIDFGNAILSKLPISHEYTIFTRLSYDPDYQEGDDYNRRNLQHVTIEYNGKPLHILNHHGHHIPEHKRGDGETTRQMQIIADYIADLSGPVVFCGDLNLEPTSSSLKPLNQQLTNLSVTHQLTTTRPPITDKVDVCDYIFVSHDIEVQSFSALPDIISDHLALLATI